MLRKSRSLIAVIFLLSALAVAIPTATIPRPVLAAASVILSPTSGSPPVNSPPVVAAGTEVTVTGTGFSGSDNTCTIASGDVSLVIDTSGEPACTVNSSGQLSAKFKVGANSYYTGTTVTVTVTGSPGADSAATSFTVNPTLAVSPNPAAPSGLVNFAGAGFKNGASGSSSACAGASPGNGAITGILAANPSTCSEDTNGNVHGSFIVVSSATSGSYIITFTDFSGSPAATAALAVTGGPSVNLSPFTGPTGTVVTVTGSGFSGGDTQVTIRTTVGPAELEVPINQVCSVTGGSINAGCTFVVSSTALGVASPGYTLSIIGSTLDFSQANFLLVSTLVVTPSNAGTGAQVALSGSGYTGVLDQADCFSDMSAFPAPLFGTLTCQIDSHGSLSGTFIVDSGAIFGIHTVKMSGAPVVQTSVFTSFTVTSPTVTLSPTAGVGGTFVAINGMGFNPSDTGCIPTSYPAGLFAAAPVAFCNVATAGQMVGSFGVSSSAPVGSYIVQLLGNPHGDVGYATFNVGTPSAQINLNPIIGGPGTLVSVTGTGFSLADSSCIISSPSPTLIGSQGSCVISSGNLAGSFTVGSSPPQGLSFVQVVGNSQGDAAVALFSVPVLLTTTTTTTSIISSLTTTSATITTTSNQITLTTTTFTVAGLSTGITSTTITTTTLGQPTISTSTTTTMTQVVTSASTSTTTISTTTTFSLVSPHAIAPPTSPAPTITEGLLELVSVLTMIAWVVFRRLAL